MALRPRSSFTINFCATNATLAAGLIHMIHMTDAQTVGVFLGGQNFTTLCSPQFVHDIERLDRYDECTGGDLHWRCGRHISERFPRRHWKLGWFRPLRDFTPSCKCTLFSSDSALQRRNNCWLCRNAIKTGKISSKITGAAETMWLWMIKSSFRLHNFRNSVRTRS